MHDRPTRSVNGGFIIMLTGLASLVYGMLAGYVIWKANHSADPSKFQDLIQTLIWNCTGASFLGVALIILGWRFAVRVRDFAPDDPDEPMMKF